MIEKNILYWIIITTVFLPLSIIEAAMSNFRDFSNTFVAFTKGLINVLFVSLSVGLAYGVALYFIHSDNEQKREKIKGYLLWGVIGIAVVYGLWGILGVLCGSFDWCVIGIPLITPP